MLAGRRFARPFEILFGALILAGLANFGWSALQGEYGVFALLRIEAEERALERELAALGEERARLENLTLRLSEGWLDLDLLDERTRAVLGDMREDEVTPR
jgi:cell division protein FtsB